jgi:hypothetical protein
MSVIKVYNLMISILCLSFLVVGILRLVNTSIPIEIIITSLISLLGGIIGLLIDRHNYKKNL